jgi:hypothetical protein
MAFDIQAAKDAGYTDAEINAYLQAKPETKTIAPVAPGQEVDPGEPPPPPVEVMLENTESLPFVPLEPPPELLPAPPLPTVTVNEPPIEKDEPTR